MQIIGRRSRQRHCLSCTQRRNAIEQRISARPLLCFGQFFQPVPAQLGVVIIPVAVRQLLVIGARHRRLIVFFGQPRPPIQRGGRFIAGGIEGDLLFELLLGFVVAPLAQRQPSRLPVRIRGARAIRKTLLQFAERIERLIVLVMHQMQIRRPTAAPAPATNWSAQLPQLIDRRGKTLHSRPKPRRLRQECRGAAPAGRRSRPATWSTPPWLRDFVPLRCSASASASSAAGRSAGLACIASSRYSSPASP